MHRLLRLLSRQPEPEWLPLPYEQAIRVPEPPRPDYRRELTPEGRLAVLEPAPGRPRSREEMREAARRLRRDLRRQGVRAEQGSY